MTLRKITVQVSLHKSMIIKCIILKNSTPKKNTTTVTTDH